MHPPARTTILPGDFCRRQRRSNHRRALSSRPRVAPSCVVSATRRPCPTCLLYTYVAGRTTPDLINIEIYRRLSLRHDIQNGPDPRDEEHVVLGESQCVCAQPHAHRGPSQLVCDRLRRQYDEWSSVSRVTRQDVGSCSRSRSLDTWQTYFDNPEGPLLGLLQLRSTCRQIVSFPIEAWVLRPVRSTIRHDGRCHHYPDRLHPAGAAQNIACSSPPFSSL